MGRRQARVSASVGPDPLMTAYKPTFMDLSRLRVDRDPGRVALSTVIDVALTRP